MKRILIPFIAALFLINLPALFAGENERAYSLGNAIELFHKADYNPAIDELKAIYKDAKEGFSARLEAAYLLGMSYKRLGSWADAAEWFQKASRYKPIADYSIFYLGEAYLGAGNYQKALNTYQDLISRFPESRWKEDAGLKVSEILFQLGRNNEARSSIERFIKENPKSSFVPKAHENIAESLEKEGKPQNAYDHYKTIWLSHPASSESMTALERMGEISAKETIPPISIDERYNRACNLLTNSYYREAVNELPPLLKEAEKNEKQPQWYPEALLRLGNAYYQIKEDEKAASVIKGLLESAPSRKISEEALFIYGKAIQKLGKRTEAALLFETITKDYPKGEYTSVAIYRLADMAEDDGSIARARELYRSLYTSFPANGLADDALWKEGWLTYLEGDYKGASITFKKLITKYSSSEFMDTAAYWSGRTAEKAENKDEAAMYYKDVINSFPLSYYAVLSKARLSIIAPESLLAEAASFTPLKQEPVSSNVSFHLNKGRALFFLGFKEDASIELSLAAARCNDKKTLMEIAGFLEKNGDYYRAQMIVMKVLREYMKRDGGGPGSEIWMSAFPLAFKEDIAANAERNSLNAFLIHAIIREESLYKHDAVSRAGAMGLMQIMPATGNNLSKKMGIKDFSTQSLYKPDINITLGSLYLKKLIGDNKGNLPLAIASYNAGPEIVSTWISRYRTEEMDEFIERIPYSETRNYVKRVLRSYDAYRRLYGPDLLIKEAAK